MFEVLDGVSGWSVRSRYIGAEARRFAASRTHGRSWCDQLIRYLTSTRQILENLFIGWINTRHRPHHSHFTSFINHGSTLGILCMTPCMYVNFALFRRYIYILVQCAPAICILITLKIECFISLDCLLWPGRRTKTCLHISSIINIRCHKKVWLPSEGDPPDREEKFIKSGEVATSERVECRNYAWVLWIWEALGLLFLVAVRTDRVMKSPKQGRFFPSWQLVGSIQNPW